MKGAKVSKVQVRQEVTGSDRRRGRGGCRLNLLMMTCYLSVEKGWREKGRQPQPHIPESS